MTTKQQSGFGVVPVIVIIAAIVVLGFVGFRFLTTLSGKPATNNATAHTQTSPASNQSSNTQASATPAVQADPNAGYVVIKEWGVRFKPVSGLNGVIYAMVPGSNTAQFSTAQIKDFGPNCDPQTEPVLGAIAESSTASVQGSTSLGKIGNNYFYYYGPQSPCSDQKSTEDIEVKTISLFKESLQSLEAAK